MSIIVTCISEVQYVAGRFECFVISFIYNPITGGLEPSFFETKNTKEVVSKTKCDDIPERDEKKKIPCLDLCVFVFQVASSNIPVRLSKRRHLSPHAESAFTRNVVNNSVSYSGSKRRLSPHNSVCAVLSFLCAGILLCYIESSKPISLCEIIYVYIYIFICLICLYRNG